MSRYPFARNHDPESHRRSVSFESSQQLQLFSYLMKPEPLPCEQTCFSTAINFAFAANFVVRY